MRIQKNANDPYWAWHREIEYQRGKAKEHACAECFGAAHDWALKAEFVSPEDYGKRKFIRDLSAYEPLCRSCHLYRDRAGVVLDDEARAKISAAQVKRFGGQGLTEETRAKMSIAQTGRVRTPEQRENYRRAARIREARRHGPL